MSYLQNSAPREGYDLAQVCLNGHMVNSAARTEPQNNQKFCSTCGAPTVTACPECNHALRGYLWGSLSVDEVVPKAFCSNCGVPYPWTQRKLSVAHALVQETELSDSDKDLLTKSLDELVRDTPETEVALVRIKKLMPKAGTVIASGLKQVLISVVTEAVKHSLWPGAH